MVSFRHCPGISTEPTEKTAQDIAKELSEHSNQLIAELGQRALKPQAIHSNSMFLFPRIRREDYEHVQGIVYECPDYLVNPQSPDEYGMIVAPESLYAWFSQNRESPSFHQACTSAIVNIPKIIGFFRDNRNLLNVIGIASQ